MIWLSSIVSLGQHFSPLADEGYASPLCSPVPTDQHTCCVSAKNCNSIFLTTNSLNLLLQKMCLHNKQNLTVTHYMNE